MTVYLWHMTATVVAVPLTHPFGLWPVTGRGGVPLTALGLFLGGLGALGVIRTHPPLDVPAATDPPAAGDRDGGR
jgi:hypothetical protein